MTQLFFDNCRRANGGIGANYTTVAGGPGGFNIASNKATPSIISNDCWSALTAIAFPANHYSRFTFSTVGVANASNHGCGPSVRTTPGGVSGNGYITTLGDVSGTELLYRPNANGVGDVLLASSGSLTWANGDSAMLSVVGSLLVLWKLASGSSSWVPVLSATDTNLTGGGPGVFYSSTATTLATLISLAFGDISSTPPIAPFKPRGNPKFGFLAAARSPDPTVVSVLLSGQRIASTPGTITASNTEALSGEAIATSAGTVVPANAGSLTADSITSSAGTLAMSISAALSGSSIVSGLGSLAPSATVAAAGTLIVSSPGTLTNEIDGVLTGSTASSAAGSVGVSVSLVLSGAALTSALGTLTPAVGASLNGSLLVSVTGSIFLTAVPIPGAVIGMGPGLQPLARNQFNTALRGQSTSINASVALTGQSLASAAGSSGAVNSEALVGSSAVSSPGALTGAPSLAIAGAPITSASGSLAHSTALSITGIAVSSTSGSLTGAFSLALTGIAVTSSAGSVSATTSKALSASAVTSSAGSLATTNATALTATSITTVSGSLNCTFSASLSGQIMAGAAGLESPLLSFNLNGQSANCAAGLMVAAFTTGLSGQGSASSGGNVLPPVTHLTGQGLTVSQGAITFYPFTGSGPYDTASLDGRFVRQAIGPVAQSFNVQIEPDPYYTGDADGLFAD